VPAKKDEPTQTTRPALEPVTDPYNVPVSVVNDIGPYGQADGIGNLVLTTFRFLSGQPKAKLDPVVCARLRFSMAMAVQLHTALGHIIEAAGKEATARKNAN